MRAAAPLRVVQYAWRMTRGIRQAIPTAPAAAGAVVCADLGQLVDYLDQHRSLMVLSGAGCSTHSGIGDYRDADGQWKHASPIMHSDFLRSAAARQRYWARSMHGWPSFREARENNAHLALAQLQAEGIVRRVITQNVDGLHQRAGSTRVVDLHGQLAWVQCLQCAARTSRDRMQRRLTDANAGWAARAAGARPDGDVHLQGADYGAFAVPECESCGGILKPEVVFFGDSVPRERVAEAMGCLQRAPALLVVGSSLMVMSGYRFVRAARAAQKPVAILGLGRTRGDAEAQLKLPLDCAIALAHAAQQLCVQAPGAPGLAR